MIVNVISIRNPYPLCESIIVIILQTQRSTRFDTGVRTLNIHRHFHRLDFLSKFLERWGVSVETCGRKAVCKLFIVLQRLKHDVHRPPREPQFYNQRVDETRGIPVINIVENPLRNAPSLGISFVDVNAAKCDQGLQRSKND